MVKLLKLTEANLNRISKGHEKDGYAILSASRESLTTYENNARTNALRDWLRNNHYSYIKVYGGYHELGESKPSIEKAFIVYPFDIVTKKSTDWSDFVGNISDIAKHFDQDTVLFCPPNGKPAWVAINPEAKEQEMSFNSIKLNDVAQKYFTALKKWRDISLNRKNHDWSYGSPQRFTFESFEDEDEIPELFLDPYPQGIGRSHMNYLKLDMNHVFLPNEEFRKMFNDDSYFDWEE